MGRGEDPAPLVLQLQQRESGETPRLPSPVEQVPARRRLALQGETDPIVAPKLARERREPSADRRTRPLDLRREPGSRRLGPLLVLGGDAPIHLTTDAPGQEPEGRQHRQGERDEDANAKAHRREPGTRPPSWSMSSGGEPTRTMAVERVSMRGYATALSDHVATQRQGTSATFGSGTT